MAGHRVRQGGKTEAAFFVLSREGQEAVAASPQGYLPLSARDAAAERARVEGMP